MAMILLIGWFGLFVWFATEGWSLLTLVHIICTVLMVIVPCDSSSGKSKGSACWIKHEHLFEPDTYMCSRCGNVLLRKENVCPKCRARVSGERVVSHWVDEAEMMDCFWGDD